MNPAVVFPNMPGLAAGAAELVAVRLRAATEQRGKAFLLLAGGSTPRAVHQELVRQPDIPWAQVEIFFGDERMVPPGDPRSNQGMAQETLLDRVAVPTVRVHTVNTGLPTEEAARDYERGMQEVFGAGSGLPEFDVIMLGVGPDGHVASLFPGRPSLHQEKRWVVAEEEPGLPPHVPRVTVTMGVINSARSVLIMAVRKGKERVLDRLFSPELLPCPHLPASLVAPRGELLWLVAEETT